MNSTPERFAILDVGGRIVALPATSVAEILPTARLQRPPGAPAILAGFLDVGGVSLAVLSGLLLFGDEPKPPTLYGHIVRLKPQDGRDLGLLVDRVEDVAAEARGRTPVDADHTLNGLVRENLIIEGQMTPCLDVARLMLREEALRIDALLEQARTRLDSLSQPTS